MENRRILIISGDPEGYKQFQSFLSSSQQIPPHNDLTYQNHHKSIEPPDDCPAEFEINYAKPGQEAFDLVHASLEENHPYAVALVDTNGPAVNWSESEVTKKIRQIDPGIELGIVCNDPKGIHDEVVESLGSYGKFLFLLKPFSAEDLVQFVLSLAKKWNLERSVENLSQEVEVRKRMEKISQQAFDEFYQIFDVATDGMEVIDKDFNIVRVNEAFSSLTRVERNNIIGRKCYEILPGPACHTDDCPVTQIIAGAKRVENEEERQCIDGDRIPCVTTAYPFRGREGGLIGIVASIKDISEWKKVEETLRSLVSDMRQTNYDLKNFAYTVSHDLQEPLLLIQSFGERLQKKYSDVLDERGLEYLQRIGDAGKRMQDLIDALLMYSRVTSNSQSFRFVDLSKVVEDVVSDLEVRIKKTNGQVIVGKLAIIDADPMQMHQLFLNLIGNALKYHRPDDPPVVRVHCEIVDEENSSRSLCKICVADEGIGFDEKYLKRIFGIFKRLHGRKDYEGTGIGLAICKRIVDRHNGEIVAKSIPGKGSEFIVTLPVTQDRRKSKIAKDYEAILHSEL